MPTLSAACVHFPSAKRGHVAGLHKSSGPASRVIPRVASGFSSGFSRSRGDRFQESDVYYGEDAPNTGFRQRPAAELGWQSRAVAQFQQRTTAECYSSFPGEVKSSCPMYLAVPVPDEVAAVFAADPTTGSRHPPMASEGRKGEVADASVDSNLRWLAARRGIE